MKIKPIILSGGSGTRLWPLSRENKPKQFFDIFNEKTNLFEETIKIAQSLCKGPTLAYGKIKELSLNSFHSSLESQLEMEARFFTESLKSKDFEIGVDSFTKKEKPDFKGH